MRTGYRTVNRDCPIPIAHDCVASNLPLINMFALLFLNILSEGLLPSWQKS